jgi:hypothetical protein
VYPKFSVHCMIPSSEIDHLHSFPTQHRPFHCAFIRNPGLETDEPDASVYTCRTRVIRVYIEAYLFNAGLSERPVDMSQ